MKLKLYYSAGACSLADHIALEWAGARYEAVRVSRAERGQPEFLAINPAGAVPVLDVDGWILTQNVAILHFIADAFPQAALAGDGTPHGRAEVNRWLAFANSDVHPAFKPLFGTTAYLGEDAAERSKQAARAALRTLFERADARLADRDWIAGGTRSIADPYLYVVARWAEPTGVDLAGLAHLRDYVARMEQDAGVRKALQDEGLLR